MTSEDPSQPADMASPEAKIALLQIARTGGTTLHHLLAQVSAPGEILDDLRTLTPDALGHYRPADVARLLAGLDPGVLERCRILAGHIPFGFDDTLPIKFSYVSFFRNPIDRLISGFVYGGLDLAHLDADQLLFGLHRSVSIAESPGFDNSLTRVLAGMGSSEPYVSRPSSPRSRPVGAEERQFAMDRIRGRFLFVGLTERFSDSCRLLFPLIGKQYVESDARLNATHGSLSKAGLPFSTLSVIERHHSHDLRIYNEACDRFSMAAQAAGLEGQETYRRLSADAGPISSGDHAHVVSAYAAFGEDLDGVWLSAQFKAGEPEYLGFDFAAPHHAIAVDIQLAADEVVGTRRFFVEVSNDNFLEDVRVVGEIAVRADGRRSRIALPAHDHVASAWRLLHRPGSEAPPLAIAYLSFEAFEKGPPRNVERVTAKLARVRQQYRTSGYGEPPPKSQEP